MSNELETIKSLIKAKTARTDFKVEIVQITGFKVRCQGDVPISYKYHVFGYKRDDDYLDEEELGLPSCAVSLDDHDLGKAMHFLSEGWHQAPKAAQEMTDPICAQLCGVNGDKCIKKFPKTGNIFST